MTRQLLWTRFIWFVCLIGLGLGWWRLIDGAQQEHTRQEALRKRLEQVENDLCPIDAHRIEPTIDPSDWHERVIGFCSESCADRWTALDDQSRARLLEAH